MNMDEALAFIQAVDWRGSRPGLARIRTLLERMGNPQDKLRFVHIAGTNGKGSTAAMLSSVLSEAGYVTGLYTSPHLIVYNERMKINGTDISDEDFLAAAAQVKQSAEGMEDPPTEFERLTAMAFLHFARCRCDIVVLEVGLGGTSDATNVISSPEASVIANIGLDHTEILGGTLEKIAREKAGIIKPGIPAVCYESDPRALAVIKDASAQAGAPFVLAAKSSLRRLSQSLEGQVFLWNGQGPFRLPLLGDHQLFNAAVVLETVRTLRARHWNLPKDAVQRGLEKVRWPARFEVLRQDPPVIVDGAHNLQCVQALAGALRTYLPGQRVLFILGVLADKDISSMLRALLPLSFEFLCVTPDSPRALSADALAERVTALGGRATACGTLEEAVGLSLRQKNRAVAACGSLYMAGAVRRLFADRL